MAPKEFFDHLARRALSQQMSPEIVREIEEAGAQQRTIVLHIYRTDNTTLVGSYGFSYRGTGRFRYHDGGLLDPTVQVALTDRTFWDIMLENVGAWTAYRQALLTFQSADNRTFYHVSFLIKLFSYLEDELRAML